MIFIPCSVDLNAKDDDGLTGFHWSCQMGQSKITKMLLEESAEFDIGLNIKTWKGKTGFHYACMNPNSDVAQCVN